MIQAYAALFAWKLSLHGVDAASTHQWVTKTWFQAINGHRDAAADRSARASTSTTRSRRSGRLAAAAQRGWSGRQLESNLAVHAGARHRRTAGERRRGVRRPDRGPDPLPGRRPPSPRGSPARRSSWSRRDITGDGRSDLLVRQADGSVAVRPGTASRHLRRRDQA